mgnify:CR=1 FL=1
MPNFAGILVFPALGTNQIRTHTKVHSPWDMQPQFVAGFAGRDPAKSVYGQIFAWFKPDQMLLPVGDQGLITGLSQPFV